MERGNEILLDKDSRFYNPIRGDKDAYLHYVAEQEELLRYYIELKNNGYTFNVENDRNEYLKNSLEEVIRTKQFKPRVFVFGSNLLGRHGAGAALTASLHYGAANGNPEGMQGNSYAIPTKDEDMNTLPLEDIADHIVNFHKVVKDNPDKEFNFTRIGCGLAGYNDKDILNLINENISEIPSNLILPYMWCPQPINRVIFAGSRKLRIPVYQEDLRGELDKFNPEEDIIITGAAWGVDSFSEQEAIRRGFKTLRVPAKWEVHGRAAGYIRNDVMADLCNGLVAFKRSVSKGTESMLAIIQDRDIKYSSHLYVDDQGYKFNG